VSKRTLVPGLGAWLFAGLACAAAAPNATPVTGAAVAPPWAFAADPPASAATPAPDDRVQKRIPGSNAAFTLKQIADLYKAPDWYPTDHPAMPPVVAVGRKPGVMACAYCHLPNGQGRPENAALAGLPATYIIQQAGDIKSGLRKSAGPASKPHALMLSGITQATAAEVKSAADYFSGLKYKPWIRVVEAATVPKTRLANYMWVPVAGGGTEPLGLRIIETPENVARTELRDSRSGFVAYVPVGSIAKGQKLATTGGGKTLPCVTCHGPDLRGMVIGPPLAGRSPSYVIRQLVNIQSGSRHGAGSQLMKPVVAKLTLEDMVALAAYTSSRPP
jgi:cytochrome c553